MAFLPENSIHGPKAKVACPYCKEIVTGDVDTSIRQHVVFQDIRHAEDPYFHYPFYFKASYRGKLIWAFNREHLQYLIDYLSADLRTVQPDLEQEAEMMPEPEIATEDSEASDIIDKIRERIMSRPAEPTRSETPSGISHAARTGDVTRPEHRSFVPPTPPDLTHSRNRSNRDFWADDTDKK